MADGNPYTELLNQILKALLPKINGEIGNAIRGAGYDPFANVASGSQGFGIGTAKYSVNNLTGLSSIQINELVVGNVTGSPDALTGNVVIDAAMSSNLSARVSGKVEIPILPDPSISGDFSLSGASVAGSGTFSAGVSGSQICINGVNLSSADFNYSSADVNIDGAGIINDILKPLENLILDAVKGDIRSLISGEIKGVLNSQIGSVLPECTNL